MKNFFSLFVASLFTLSAVAADDVTLLFEDATKNSGATYNVSESSEYPHVFRIINHNENNMYRLFAIDNGPKLFDYQGVEIEFDYVDPLFEVPVDLEFFFSVDGFKNGYYPSVIDLLKDESIIRINFHEKEDGEYVWSKLFYVSENPDDATLTDFSYDVSPDAIFNRFGFRNGGDRGTEDVIGSVIDVKLKSIALIDNDGNKEYFDILGGGVHEVKSQGYEQSYRLYGPSMDLTLKYEGSVLWNVEESYKYANIHLASPLSAEAAEYLIFFADQDYGDGLEAKGLEEGSELIIVNIEEMKNEFELSSDAKDFSLNIDIKAIILSDEEGKGLGISDVISDNEELPAFVNVYAINGQLIKMNVARETALDGLAKGIYIVHNKKVAVY